MTTRIIGMLHRARGAWFVFIALLFVLGAIRPASAQWTLDSAYQT